MKNVKLLALATLSAPLFLFSPPVGAGTNGQQVSVRATGLNWGCRSGISVTVSGTNQANQYATRTVQTGCDGIARTYNSWFKGNVKIDIHNRVFNQRKTCYANVPVNQGWSNHWYHVTCW